MESNELKKKTGRKKYINKEEEENKNGK